MLEDARSITWIFCALTGEQLALLGNVDSFARSKIANQGKAQHIQRDALGSDHVLDALIRMTLTENDGANGIRVAKADDAVASDHRHHCITATTPGVNPGHGCKDIVFGWLQLVAHGQLMRKHVEQHLRVGTGVHMPQI